MFEDYLYATNSDNFDIIRINRFNGTDIHSLIKMENARGIRIYQKRTQPTGKTQDLLIGVEWEYGPCALYGVKMSES